MISPPVPSPNCVEGTGIKTGIKSVFRPLPTKKKNPSKPLYLQEKKLEAGVRIELTIGVLQFVG
jgi:hypothetical protein